MIDGSGRPFLMGVAGLTAWTLSGVARTVVLDAPGLEFEAAGAIRVYRVT